MICRASSTYRTNLFGGLIVDNFAGGGGAGLGIEQALGRPVDHAINHDAQAIAMHRINHPGTEHHHSDVWEVDPRDIAQGRPIDLAWFSPDCKHFSKAKGGKPVSPRVRGLAWVVIRWAELVRPRMIMLENVEEFKTWGPLTDEDLPCPDRKGDTFRGWVNKLRMRGYDVEWRELRACDYGTPTIRKRLFLVARCDGKPIVWPEATHGVDRQPYRTAAECIDWSNPCPSIFERKRPLADNTLRRIAAGIKRYVLDSADPFIVSIANYGGNGSPCHSTGDPLTTVTANPKGGHHAVCVPTLVGVGGRAGQSRPRSADEPAATLTAKADTALMIPTLVQTGYGERKGQAPRVPGLEKPLGTVVAGGGKHALVAAFLAQHNSERGSGVKAGRAATKPFSTVTTSGSHQSVVAAHLMHNTTGHSGGKASSPLHTITTGSNAYKIAALLVKYYGSETGGYSVDEPIHTIPTKDRYGLVTVELNGEPYVITDIGMRMLQPRELYRAQGFGDDYVIDRGIGRDGGLISLTKTAQVRMCGNSVAPPAAEALVRANIGGAS